MQSQMTQNGVCLDRQSAQNSNADKSSSVMVKEILTEKEAAIYIGMSRSFLSQDRMNGYREGRTPGPVFMKLGRAVRYRKGDLDAWLSKHRVIREFP